MKKVVVKNQEELQKHVLTTVEHDFKSYEQKVMFKLLEISQKALLGEDLKPVLLTAKSRGYTKITIPLQEFTDAIGTDDLNIIKDTLEGVHETKFEYDTEDFWKGLRFIESPKIEKEEGIVSLEVSKEVWKALASFKK